MFSAVGAERKIMRHRSTTAAAPPVMPSLFIVNFAAFGSKDGLAIPADGKGDTFFDSNEGNEEKTEIVIDPFDIHVKMAARRTRPGLLFQPDRSGLYTTDQEKH
jgi:hypothetical protein